MGQVEIDSLHNIKHSCLSSDSPIKPTAHSDLDYFQLHGCQSMDDEYPNDLLKFS